MEYFERHKEPSEPLQLYHDLRGIMKRSKREGKPVYQLRMRESDPVRDMMVTIKGNVRKQ